MLRGDWAGAGAAAESPRPAAENINKQQLIAANNAPQAAGGGPPGNVYGREASALYHDIEDLFESLAKNLITCKFNNALDSGLDAKGAAPGPEYAKLIEHANAVAAERERLEYCSARLAEVDKLLNISEPEKIIKKNGVAWDIDDVYLKKYQLKLNLRNQQEYIRGQLSRIGGGAYKLKLADYYRLAHGGRGGQNGPHVDSAPTGADGATGAPPPNAPLRAIGADETPRGAAGPGPHCAQLRPMAPPGGTAPDNAVFVRGTIRAPDMDTANRLRSVGNGPNGASTNPFAPRATTGGIAPTGCIAPTGPDGAAVGAIGPGGAVGPLHGFTPFHADDDYLYYSVADEADFRRQADASPHEYCKFSSYEEYLAFVNDRECDGIMGPLPGGAVPDTPQFREYLANYGDNLARHVGRHGGADVCMGPPDEPMAPVGPEGPIGARHRRRRRRRRHRHTCRFRRPNAASGARHSPHCGNATPHWGEHVPVGHCGAIGPSGANGPSGAYGPVHCCHCTAQSDNASIASLETVSTSRDALPRQGPDTIYKSRVIYPVNNLVN